MGERFAVIDTETNWRNELMSAGIVIAEDGVFEALDKKYIIIKEAARVGGLYSSSLYLNGLDPLLSNRYDGVREIIRFLEFHGVQSIFAYNALFDARCLPELHEFTWHDILRMAAYKQYNPAIPYNAKCCGTGRLKSGYKVGDILHMFGELDYYEQHNAITDAIDELRIMKHLRHSLEKYPEL